MKEKTIFFERIQQIIDYKGIKNVNVFAIEYLKYDAPQKINRLKKEGANPSFEILLDIVNKFEEIDANWLLTGEGKMLKYENVEKNISESSIAREESVTYGESYWKGRYDQLKEDHERLLKELDDIKSQPNKSSHDDASGMA